MGMFDSVMFRCPKCDSQMEVQSKAGECTLREYEPWSVPESIAKDIAGQTAFCDNCDKQYRVGGEGAEKTVSVSISEAK